MDTLHKRTRQQQLHTHTAAAAHTCIRPTLSPRRMHPSPGLARHTPDSCPPSCTRLFTPRELLSAPAGGSSCTATQAHAHVRPCAAAAAVAPAHHSPHTQAASESHHMHCRAHCSQQQCAPARRDAPCAALRLTQRAIRPSRATTQPDLQPKGASMPAITPHLQHSKPPPPPAPSPLQCSSC
jgi:hypothetical protein